MKKIKTKWKQHFTFFTLKSLFILGSSECDSNKDCPEDKPICIIISEVSGGFCIPAKVNMSLVVRKPVFGVSDQARHKPGCTVTEDG